MKKTIVTVWWGDYNGFIDIDGLACAVAYAELLRLEGKDARAVLMDPLNTSITPSLRSIAKSYVTQQASGDAYVIVDISDPKIISSFVPLDKIVEIYDHHFWYESYWNERLGAASVIEYIGAASTLIWEEYNKRDFAEGISQESAMLLAHAIISNTANFRSNTTTPRDRIALQELEKIAALEDNWQVAYFQEQQEYIRENIAESIRLDTKICDFPILSGPCAFGQIEIWNTSSFLRGLDLDAIFSGIGFKNWIFNLMDIASGKTVIVSNKTELLSVLSNKLGLPIIGNAIPLETVIFRKEIVALLA